MADDPRQVRVLALREAVRRRPGMYVGDVEDGSGLHVMLAQIVVDALARRPTAVTVTLDADGSVTVADDGGPFPGGIAAAMSGMMTYEPGMLPVWCALTSRFDVRQRCDGAETLARFIDGHPAGPTIHVAAHPPEAPPLTEVTYLAAAEVFGTVAYDRALVARQLADLGRGEPSVALTLVGLPSGGGEGR